MCVWHTHAQGLREYLIKLLKYLFFSSLWALSHCLHFSCCPLSLLIGCCCRKPVKYTSSTLGCLIGEGLWLAAGYLPATSTRPRCPRAQPWLLKQREKGVCATSTCATVITSTVGGLTPALVFVVQLLAAVEGFVGTPPVTHIKSKEAIGFKLVLLRSWWYSLLGYVQPEHQRSHVLLLSTSHIWTGLDPAHTAQMCRCPFQSSKVRAETQKICLKGYL